MSKNKDINNQEDLVKMVDNKDSLKDVISILDIDPSLTIENGEEDE